MTLHLRVVDFMKMALECSVYVKPQQPGLTRHELFEIGRSIDFQKGEITDAIAGAAAPMYIDDKRLQPSGLQELSEFHWREDPDCRGTFALDLVVGQLFDLVRSQGIARGDKRSNAVSTTAHARRPRPSQPRG